MVLIIIELTIDKNNIYELTKFSPSLASHTNFCVGNSYGLRDYNAKIRMACETIVQF